MQREQNQWNLQLRRKSSYKEMELKFSPPNPTELPLMILQEIIIGRFRFQEELSCARVVFVLTSTK